jgi:hypothetical protein
MSELLKSGEELYAKVCEVTAIDEAAKTADVKPVDGTAEIFGVPLQADTQGGGLVIFPKMGSNVLVAFTGKHTAVAVGFGEVDKAALKIGDTSIEATAGGIVVNGGENGGLAITPELVAQLEKMSARIDGIIDAISNGVPVPQDGGAALQASIKVSLAAIVDKEDFSNVENKKIKQ